MGANQASWSVLFDAVQAVAVVVGIPFAIAQLRELNRGRRRSSLETMLPFWERSGRARGIVLKQMPIYEGSPSERTLKFAKDLMTLVPARDVGFMGAVRAARVVINNLNDLGGFVERGSVHEDDFFGHFHISLVKLIYKVEPYILLENACLESRWGLRLLRIRSGAEAFNRREAIHHKRRIVLDGVTLVQATDRPVRQRHWLRPSRLIPRKEEAAALDDQLVNAVKFTLRDAGIDCEKIRQHLNEIFEEPSDEYPVR